ncbi:MAG: hypothetical protein ACWA40_08935 [Planktomarina sp.]
MIIKWVLLGLLIVMLCAATYVRLAAIAAKHFEPRDMGLGLGEYMAAGGSLFVLPDVSDAQFQQLMDHILQTSRLSEVDTQIPATRIFIVRSWLWGFPDVIHVTRTADVLILDGRLVFGQSDFGVNRRRILGWLNAAGIDPLT